MEKDELIVRVEGAHEIFKLYSPPKQPLVLEEAKYVAEEIKQSLNV